MTNELAIRIITGDVLGTNEQTQEAITMAVKALLLPSAQSNLQQTCNKLATDTISRQEAIDLVRDVCNVVMSGCNSHYDSEIGGEIYDDILEVNAILKCNKQVKIALRNMPSAQPDNQTNLCDSCDYSYPDCPTKNDDVIFGNGIGNDNICACNKYKPSAQPEIITCIECKYYDVDTEQCNNDKGLQFIDFGNPERMWCSWAERQKE